MCDKLKCGKCGFPLDPEPGNDSRCPMCGWNRFVVYTSSGKVKLQSEGDEYYEFAPDSLPFKEDAWGRYYLGKCFSKTDSHFLKAVSVCVVSNSTSYYTYPLLGLLNDVSQIDFSHTAFIPLIGGMPYGDGCCLIEDFYNGVSLYDLMQGNVCGVDGQSIEFAVKMYDMYNNHRVDFAKIVIKEILTAITFIHDNEICLRYIEPPECVFFTADGKIKIRMINSLFYECWLHRRMGFTIRWQKGKFIVTF